MRALATLGTLVDFVMFVERGAGLATLMEVRRADESEYKVKTRIKKKERGKNQSPLLTALLCMKEEEYLF